MAYFLGLYTVLAVVDHSIFANLVMFLANCYSQDVVGDCGHPLDPFGVDHFRSVQIIPPRVQSSAVAVVTAAGRRPWARHY